MLYKHLSFTRVKWFNGTAWYSTDAPRHRTWFPYQGFCGTINQTTHDYQLPLA